MVINIPDRIRLVEVGLRDGLQAVVEPLATEDKIEIIHELIDAGVKEIEAVSFAHPRVLPQLADAEEVMRQVPRDKGAIFRGLVPNLRGAQRAVKTGLDEWAFVIAADEETSLRNQRRSVGQMLDELKKVSKLAAENDVKLIVAVACAFFAPAKGTTPEEDYLRVVNAAVEAGAPALYLAGTTGQEHPVEMGQRIRVVNEKYPDLELGVHLHNRNGFAQANALAAMDAGISWIEGSFCGYGGDLWFPGDASVLGNAPLEDLIHFCEVIGVQTGISLEKYLTVVGKIEKLTGIKSTSFVTRGGSRNDLATAKWPSNAGSASVT